MFNEQSVQLSEKFKFHFGIHYSTSAYIALYLARLYPYPSVQIKLQTDKLETPNRQLSSMCSLFLIFLESFDNREAIPEVLTSFEYFYNLNFVYFGLSKFAKESNLVHNIVVPSNFKSPCEFVCACRYVLNHHLKRTIHKWINMIFGEKQYTDKPKKEGYYVYRKSSYAQKMDLIQKVSKYKAKLSFNDLANKMHILRSDILCFGQSPQILFEHGHSEWEERETKKDKSQDEFSYMGNFTWDSMKSVVPSQPQSTVLHFNLTSENDKLYIVKKVFFSKRQCHIYEIEIPKDNVSIQIQKMKFFNKRKQHSSKQFLLNSTSLQQQPPINAHAHSLLHPKYSMFDLCNGKYFVTGRNHSGNIVIYQSIKGHDNKTRSIKDFIYKEIYTGSFVSVLYQVDSASFFSGHRTGRMIEWEIRVHERRKKESDLNDTCFVAIKRDVLCHNNAMITCIHYNRKHNVILTCAEDGNIFIRKYYDFELMVVIGNLKGNEMYNDICVSNYDLLYATFCEKKGNGGNYLVCYSLNGIKAGSLVSDDNKKLTEINNAQVTSYGKIIVCGGNENLYLVNAFNLSETKLYKPEHKTNNADESGSEGKIVSFIYSEKMNLMHCLYSNNDIVRNCDDMLTTELKGVTVYSYFRREIIPRHCFNEFLIL